jgi:hypothetical protein
MTRTAEAARLAGYGVMAAGTWYHRIRLIPFGFLVIVAAWLYGLIWPAHTSVMEYSRSEEVGI